MAETPQSRSRARWALYAGVALGLAGAVSYFALRSPRHQGGFQQPPWAGNGRALLVPVRTVVAAEQELALHLKAIGTVTPLNTVAVRSRVGGQVLRVAFEEGQPVAPGQLLAEIDPAPYRIRLSQAEGQLKQNAARLQSARADFARVSGLHSRKLVTDQERDVQQALVLQLEGALAASQAQVDDARLQLGYTRIESPIAGRAGLRRIDPGNLVREGDTTGIVTVTQTRPIAVSFTIPEADLAAVLTPFRAGKALAVEARDRRDTTVLANGVLKMIDNQIDTATGTLRLKAEFPNEDERLFPNQFVNVQLQVGTLRQAIVIPAATVLFGSKGTYVYVVGADKKAAVREVVLGPVDGVRQAVTKGLRPGEQVVIEGLDRLRDGRGVVIVNEAPVVGSTAAAVP